MARKQLPETALFPTAPRDAGGAAVPPRTAGRVLRDPGLEMPGAMASRAMVACAVTAIGLVLAGCSSAPKQVYPETFKDTNTYSRAFPASDAATCEAARRALLSQGYTIGKAQADGVEGHKNFQVRDEDQQHQVISFHVVCTSDHGASPQTTVFVNAVQDRYIIKKTSSSAGVGLSVLGSVSMPFSSNDDSLAKVSSETISSPGFYEGFFDLLRRYLPQAQAQPQPQPRSQSQSAGQSAGQSQGQVAPKAAGDDKSSGPAGSPASAGPASGAAPVPAASSAAPDAAKATAPEAGAGTAGSSPPVDAGKPATSAPADVEGASPATP